MALKLMHRHMVMTFELLPKYIGTKAIQITSVVYIVKPINLASLKFSGTFLVFTAYTVHMAIKKKSKPSGAMIPSGVVLQIKLTLFKDGYEYILSAGSKTNIVAIIPDSMDISIHVITT